MSDRVFLDTNIFVYSREFDDPHKQSIANDLIRSATVAGEATISYQVMQEFFNVALRKSPVKLRHEDAQRYLATTFRPLHIVPPSIALVSEAIRIQERYRLSWYDSLIAAAALQGGCRILYSEDLQHGQQIDSLTIQDPFR
jgi:predicted nucleic acid-binding protein